MYIEDANRLVPVEVEVAVREAMVRPTHQRRVAIAAVTDTLRVNPRTHAEMMRDLVMEPYTPLFVNADTAEAAYAEPRCCQAAVEHNKRATHPGQRSLI